MGSFFNSIYVMDISTVFIAIPLLLLVWSVIGAALYEHMRIIGAVLAVVAVVAVLYVTVLTRSENGLGADLIPLSSFERAKIRPGMYRSMLMNVFLFVPLGFSLPYVFSGRTVNRILLTVFIGLVLSVAVETVQYFCSLGMTETDDVICNTLGAAIGSCAYPLSLLWRKLFAKDQRKEMNDE